MMAVNGSDSANQDTALLAASAAWLGRREVES